MDERALELLDERLVRVRAALDSAPTRRVEAADLKGLAEALVGAELAAARLIVAAADPRTERVATAGDVARG